MQEYVAAFGGLALFPWELSPCARFLEPLVPVSAAASAGSPASYAVPCTSLRRGQLLAVPCAQISTEVKVFSLAESQAELMLKMYSMSTYHANFVGEQTLEQQRQIRPVSFHFETTLPPIF